MTRAAIRLKRHGSHWRAVLLSVGVPNLALSLGMGLILQLSEAIPLALRLLVFAAVLILAVVAAVHLQRRRERRSVAVLEMSPTHLVLTQGRRGPTSVPRASLKLRRLAYLRHEGGAVDHLPVLEIRAPSIGTLRIVGPGAHAWPRFDAELRSSTVQYEVFEGRDWEMLRDLVLGTPESAKLEAGLR